MSYKEKRDHKFKILFMYDFKNGNLDDTINVYFDNLPYDDDNPYIDGDNKSHRNVSKVVISEDEETTNNESDKAVKITLDEEDDRRDIKNKLNDLVSKIDIIDKFIKESLVTWDINRIGKAELTILRLAVYEMYFDKTIDIAVAINEAIELSKVYGDDKANQFINGVLSTIYKKNERSDHSITT